MLLRWLSGDVFGVWLATLSGHSPWNTSWTEPRHDVGRRGNVRVSDAEADDVDAPDLLLGCLPAYLDEEMRVAPHRCGWRISYLCPRVFGIAAAVLGRTQGSVRPWCCSDGRPAMLLGLVSHFIVARGVSAPGAAPTAVRECFWGLVSHSGRATRPGIPLGRGLRARLLPAPPS